MGLRLWGMAELPFWPAPKASSTSPTSVRARCRISVPIISMVAPTDAHAHSSSAWRSRAMTWVAGTAVSPRAPTHVGLDPGIDVGVGPHRARQLPHRDPVARGAQPGPVAIGLEAPQGQLGPEGGGLGVHAVGATGHGRVHELERPAPSAPTRSASEASRSRSRGARQGGAQRGVDHVGRREAVVDPRSLGRRRWRPGPRRRRRPRRGR